MSTKIPDILQINAVSFEEMNFCIGSFHFSNAIAFIFNGYEYEAEVDSHTVICFLLGQRGDHEVLYARIVADGGFQRVLGHLDVNLVPARALEDLE